MGTRSVVACLALVSALVACNEQQEPESVAGPSLAGRPTDPAACDPNSLNSLISGYFPGNTGSNAKAFKDALIAAGPDSAGISAGYSVLQEIGKLSRGMTVDGVAGSNLAKGIIKCMFSATVKANFTPTFPSDSIYNFARALDAGAGGAFYVRGAGTNNNGLVQGAIDGSSADANILSGVMPLSGTWTDVLDSNTISFGKVLIYGYQTKADPLEYEWATIPPAAKFDPQLVVAICDGTDTTTAMIHESSIGVLAYQSASTICTTAPVAVTLKDTGWGPRALAARLARVVVDAVRPQPLQAAMLKSGTGGTATTFKSKFSKKGVTSVALTFTTKPPSRIKLGATVTAEVRATTLVDAVTTGVNGVCVYLRGTNNNGQGTSLVGSHDQRCQVIDETVDAYTSTKSSSAGYASFSFKATKTGGLVITATATDDTGSLIGVVGRNGQTFTTDQVKVNVNP
jgi:hypothetical protein